MPLNFPASPTNGQIYENYRWNSTVGAWQSILGGAIVTMSETAPANPANGQLWFNETEGKMYVSYNDGTSTQWVSAVGGLASQTGTAGDLLTYDGTSWVPSSVNDALGAGKVLQVVSITKTDTFSASLAAGAISDQITGFTASITPSSTSSKILVSASVTVSHTSSTRAVNPILYRNGAVVTGATGDAASNRVRVTSGGLSMSGTTSTSVPVVYVDSPATVSAVTYDIRLHNANDTADLVYLNRTASDTDNSRNSRAISTITLIEVAG